MPLLKGTAPRVKQMAISQVRPLGKNYSHLLAYSVRTADYRYIQWLDTNRGFQPVNAELYDLRTATAETRNVVHDPAYHDVVQAMEREVPRPPVVKTKERFHRRIRDFKIDGVKLPTQQADINLRHRFFDRILDETDGQVVFNLERNPHPVRKLIWKFSSSACAIVYGEPSMKLIP